MRSNRMTPEEYKGIIKELLGEFHTFCVENGLRYFAAFGTLIGAVRHNGFIPWDDDIDVCMPRDDYEKLLSMTGKGDLPFYTLSAEGPGYYYNSFARFCSRKGYLRLNGVIDMDDLGPFIDIFPLDAVPEDREERLRHYREVEELGIMLRYSLPARYYRSLPMKKRIKMSANLPRRWKALRVGTETLKARREEQLLRYRDTDTELLSSTFDLLSDALLVRKEEAAHIELHPFEDIEVYIPSAYDPILRRYYGDYMELPPEEERVSRHHFTPYWREEA